MKSLNDIGGERERTNAEQRMFRRQFLKGTASCVSTFGLPRGLWSAKGFGLIDSEHLEAAGLTRAGIYLNQVGFLPDIPKVASVSIPATSFAIRSLVDNSIVFRSTLSARRYDPASGDNVQLADFTALKTPGQYRLEIDPGAVSDPIVISEEVYNNALLLTMRAFYGQRCGCAVDLGGGYAHPACHLEGAFHPSSGKSGPFANHGGWHDAGDYGRYIVNSGIATGMLLWAWELYGLSLRHLSLHIPESGGNVPDVLAEIRWNLEWMLSMQDEDGGVWHK